jgi:hypothetical protein
MTATLKLGLKHLTRAALVFALMIISWQARAATIAEYRDRVSQAATVVQRLRSDAYRDNSLERDAFIDGELTRVRTLLPARETVLLNGQTIEVDNSWLHETLSRYEKEKIYRSKGEEILGRIHERLQALMVRVDEMQAGKPPSDKDSDKARLAEILRRPEYAKSAAEGSAIERLWEQFIRWLSKLFPKVKPLQPGTGRALSGIAQVVVIAISVALIAFLIWKFVPRYLRNRGKKKKKREARIVLGERLEPDQTAADLLEQAEALARKGDLRGAIRKAYIALLCELGDRKVISLAQHKTNRDYLMAVRNRSALYQSMRGLTHSFELHWYGFVPPAANDWDQFRAGCRNAVRVGQS